MNNSRLIQTQCCIAGGGPAGMMLGLLLARAGINVHVLEKHADFFRDFRGDAVHPSTLEIMYELGMLDEFLKLPHQRVMQLNAQIGTDSVIIADFSHVPTHCKFIALMPQWDLLNFLAKQASDYSDFHLHMNCEVTDLIFDQKKVIGLKAQTLQGELEVHANLVVGADGRSSIVRRAAGLEVIDFGAPIDALWMRISKLPGDPQQILGRIDTGKMLVILDRGNYWQCAFVIPKGNLEAIKQKGLQAFQSEIAALAPFLGSRITELKDWEQIRLLTVQVNRLRKWFLPGLLCIGDAAHAMSPIGGVGINLAIQDAVAAANAISKPLRKGTVSTATLHQLQRRREFPTSMTQGLQLFIQNGLIKNVIRGTRPMHAPWFVQLAQHWTVLRRIPALVVGVGFRPEHVRINEYGN
jgi:2-polyprenyl-6-methoxyphenol hydroxylase-like FAD-dependent oxidoreductase